MIKKTEDLKEDYSVNMTGLDTILYVAMSVAIGLAILFLLF